MRTATPTISELLLDQRAPETSALVAGTDVVSRAELGRRVDERHEELDLPERSLVVLGGDAPALDYVVTYLALLDGGHVPLLAGAHAERLAAAWDPTAVIEIGPDGASTIDRRHRAGPELHRDLALLMSTSGSTGSPKLVRLSHTNLVSNATTIAEFLQLSERDRGITSLPLHYCYGLSVLHSHLAVGGSVVLTNASVVDPCFRVALEAHGVTNIAGVPHTYDLLERRGADQIHVDTLRVLTQAGGRMAPDHVRRWIDRTEAWGADFYVMYGQTEATARMAYLPPEAARRRPEAIGAAIPGGSLELRPVEGQPDGVGELVYSGPNVMLGYAVGSDDLAAGAELDELATGDLARFHPDAGVFEIVGRRSRFVKPFGLRIDLDLVERELAALGEAVVAGDDGRVLVLAPDGRPDVVAARAAEVTGLPTATIEVRTDVPVPRTSAGKVDYAAVAASFPEPPGDEPRPGASAAEPDAAAVYAHVLGRRAVAPTDSFVSLGGDSLSYIECSIRLERVIGRLPADWHLRPVSQLTPSERRPRFGSIDTTVPLRALGICLVVSTHMAFWRFPGGAHMMLAVVGYNVARFLAPIESTRERVTAGLRTAARAALPTVAWIATGMLAFGAYSVGTLLLVNNYVGPPGHRDDLWHFWFIEVFVQLVLLTTLLLTVPGVRRVDRRWPFAFPLALFGLAVVLRLDWAQVDGDWYNMRFRTHSIAWFFLLGWLAQRSATWPRRIVTSALCVATIPGWFHYAPREWFIAGALVLLTWCPKLPCPRLAAVPVATLATASMWVYVSHFTVWPRLQESLPGWVAYVGTIVAGVVISIVVTRTLTAGRRLLDRRPAMHPVPPVALQPSA